MPKVIGNATRVVEVEGLSIDEYVGNVGSKTDNISIAVVTVSEPSAEPWLTLDYDEWMVVIKGRVEIHYGDEGHTVTAKEGETIFIEKGERFRPVFPIPGKYVPVCIPAFKPERCKREEDDGINTSDVSDKLAKLHSDKDVTSISNGPPIMEKSSSTPTSVIYHMCQQVRWEEAVTSKRAYYPPTFVQDGYFTHATSVPSRLLETANHFYTATTGKWICLELSTQKLEEVGIITRFEEPKPVGEQSICDNWESNKWECPHIYGGIPVNISGIVIKTYDMKRDAEGNFLSIVGLTDTF